MNRSEMHSYMNFIGSIRSKAVLASPKKERSIDGDRQAHRRTEEMSGH